MRAAGFKAVLCQLAFACWLRCRLPALQGNAQAYDPVFSKIDQQLLQGLGFKVHNARQHPILVTRHATFQLL